MTSREKFFLNTFIGIFILYFLYIIRSVLPPFIIGAAIAYFTHHLVDKMEAKQASRSLASMLIVILLILIVIVLIIFIIPLIYNQFIALAKEFSYYIQSFSEFFSLKVTEFIDFLDINGLEDARVYISQYSKGLVNIFTKIINNLIASSMAFFNILSILVITPVTTYYFLHDWHKIINTIEKYIPNSKRKTVRILFKEIDKMLSSYIKGQFNVCMVLGIFYAVLLTIVGLEFGLIIGILAGLLTFIPYLGAFLGAAIGLFTGYFQWGLDFVHLATVLGVFGVGQFLEGSFVTPRLIGQKIGLHPMWIIFALFVGGALMGFAGIILALPMAAIIGVIVRFFLKQYERNNK